MTAPSVPQAPTLSHTELRVAATLEDLARDVAACAEQAAQRAEGLQRQARRMFAIGLPDACDQLLAQAEQERAERAFFRRGATAYTNALAYWLRGIRPQRLPHGCAYVLPSIQSGQGPHLVSKDGDWTCTCQAGSAMHWPIAMLIGIELAGDQADAEDDAPLPFEPEPERTVTTRVDARGHTHIAWFIDGDLMGSTVRVTPGRIAEKLDALARDGYHLVGDAPVAFDVTNPAHRAQAYADIDELF